jgi:dipeptidyl aminopeptidase/acylaminoacyl peptidase
MNRTLFLTVPLLALVLSSAALPQANRAMSLIDMLEVPTVNEPRLSPDGKQVVFTVSKADWKANNRVTHLWRINADGTGLVQLTNGQRNESAPAWSPDGTRIAFITQRAGSESEEAGQVAQIFLINNSGGEAEQLTRHETAVMDLTWGPRGDCIYFRAAEPKAAKQKAREKAKDDVYAFDENFRQVHLWKISLADKKELRITQGDFSINSYSLSRDGTKAVLSRGPSPLYGDQDQNELYLMDVSGSNPVRLTHNRIEEEMAAISPDNSRVLFVAGANERFETYYNNKLFLVAAGGGEARYALKDFPYPIDWVRWSKDGKSFLAICNLGVTSQFFRIDPESGEYLQLSEGDHVVGGDTYCPAQDKDAFTLSHPQAPAEVYLFDAASRVRRRITHVCDYIGHDFMLPKEERIRWRGSDGVTVEGILTYPLDYREGTRYPLVVNTHGGPQASDKLSFSSWSQYRPVLAAKGYAVLRPNYRGSTGYGDTFLRDMVGHYFSQAHLDVMAGVDHLIQRGIADPDRMVKMGWSAGGHMTNKIITFTDRFKAASSGAGAADWISMYAQSDVRSYRTPWFGGTPWQKDAPIVAYWDNSPLKDVWKVKTPTIFLVGAEDVRVPMPQSVEMYRALRSNGIPTHLYVAPREPHGWRELRHELFKMNVELEWFEKWATKRPYVREVAPGEEKEEKNPEHKAN